VAICWQLATPPYIISADGIGDMGTRFVDLNGDDCRTLVVYRAVSGGTYVTGGLPQYGNWMGVGTRVHAALHHLCRWHIGDMGTRFVDLEWDGLPDLCGLRAVSGGTYVTGAYLNTGTGWVSGTRVHAALHHLCR